MLSWCPAWRAGACLPATRYLVWHGAERQRAGVDAKLTRPEGVWSRLLVGFSRLCRCMPELYRSKTWEMMVKSSRIKLTGLFPFFFFFFLVSKDLTLCGSGRVGFPLPRPVADAGAGLSVAPALPTPARSRRVWRSRPVPSRTRHPRCRPRPPAYSCRGRSGWAPRVGGRARPPLAPRGRRASAAAATSRTGRACSGR